MDAMTAGSYQESISGTTYTINPKVGSTDGRKSSKLHKIFAILAAVFLLTTVLFVVLFAVYYSKYESKAPAQENVCKTADCIHSAPAQEVVCKTADCVHSASAMLKKMNPKIDPCQDFSEYACGTFIREAVFPDGRGLTSSFSVLDDQNKLIMKEIILEDIKAGDPAYVNNMKKLYASCINEAKIESVGLSGYWSDPLVADWPTLTPAWSDVNFDLNTLIMKYARLFTTPLFSFQISEDSKDSSKRVLQLSEPSLSLSQESFSRPRNDSAIMAYEKFLAEVAVALNASRATSEADAQEVVDLEIKLSKIMVPREEKRDYNKLYNVVYLNNLTHLYPKIDIARALKKFFSTANVTLADNEKIINRFPTYIGNLSLVLGTVSNRTIQNLFGFKYALSKVLKITRRLREIQLDLDKVILGTKAEKPLWEVCLDEASKVFLKVMSMKFVDKSFSNRTKSYILEMVEKIQEEFRKMISENSWMSQKTKDEAYKKLAAIKKKIGYPDVGFSDADINKLYENYTMTEDNYFQNKALYTQISKTNSLLYLRKPVDKNDWSEPPYETNAYYSAPWNEMVLPAGILQPPFFSPKFEDSMNYGGIGVIIGHELTHGFDDEGSQYDADGNLRNWWQQSERENFLQRTQCIVNQNSNFFVAEINMTLNGINTQAETVSDIGGLKESFRAFKELERSKGKSPTLPGLNLSQDQLFFLSFGQLWCEKMTTELWINQITTEKHPPGKYRILGTLQNSEEFAKAYSCPQTSYMNPVKKCAVW